MVEIFLIFVKRVWNLYITYIFELLFMNKYEQSRFWIFKSKTLSLKIVKAFKIKKFFLPFNQNFQSNG